MVDIRCSDLPRLDQCLGEAGSDYIRISVQSDAATSGTKIHDATGSWIVTSEMPDDSDSGFRVFKMIKRILTESEYSPRFKLHIENHVEESLVAEVGSLRLSGHPDLYGLTMDGLEADVYDWKTGFKVEVDYLEQIKGYAYLIVRSHPMVESVRGIIITRDNAARMKVWTRPELVSWAESKNNQIAQWNGRDFKKNEHCQYCKRQYSCPALLQIVKSSVEAFSTGEMTFDLTDPATCIRLWQISGEAEKAIKNVRDSIKDQLARAGENGMVADGQRIYLAPSIKRIIDPVFAWQTLEEELTTEDLAQCVEVKITRLEEALKSNADKGQKQANVDRVMFRLRECGGLKSEPGASRVTIKKES
jgi:hypothetical protein